MKKRSMSYAIAELAVIVVGVLIALFAESAWNDHNGRREGKAYLSRLSAELQKNLEYLNDDIAWTQQACHSTESALAEIRKVGAQPDPALTLRLVVSSATFPSPDYQRVTFDDLIGTGNLSLIESASLREDIVSVYTNFLEGLSAWRPPKDTAIRKAAVRTLPSEYIVRVISECLVDHDTGMLRPSMRACNTVPATHSPEFWFEKLLDRPDIEGALSERAWQVCDFSRSMSEVQNQLEQLINELDSADI
jgi:hypothetical protein